jgi:hypothetical protein
LGINIYEDIDFKADFDDDDDGLLESTTASANADAKSSDFSKKTNEFALMTAPPRHVLKALDEKNRNDKSGHYVVGFDSSGPG